MWTLLECLVKQKCAATAPSAAPPPTPPLSSSPISWPCPPCYYRAKCCNTNIASWNVSDSGWVVRPSVFDLSSLPVDALTGGAPDCHGNKGPLLLLVKGLNCCEDLMIQSSIQGRRYYQLFVSSFFIFFPLHNLFRILTLYKLVVFFLFFSFWSVSLKSACCLCVFFRHMRLCQFTLLSAQFNENASAVYRCEEWTRWPVQDDKKLWSQSWVCEGFGNHLCCMLHYQRVVSHISYCASHKWGQKH